jgi:hypothetical protein
MLDAPDGRQNAQVQSGWGREAMSSTRGFVLTEFQWIPLHQL